MLTLIMLAIIGSSLGMSGGFWICWALSLTYKIMGFILKRVEKSITIDE